MGHCIRLRRKGCSVWWCDFRNARGNSRFCSLWNRRSNRRSIQGLIWIKKFKIIFNKVIICPSLSCIIRIGIYKKGFLVVKECVLYAYLYSQKISQVYKSVVDVKMKTKMISLVLVLAGLLLWWEIPMLCITCVIFNVFLMIKNYEKGMFYNLIIVMSFIVLILCIWNWDLHVGIYILEHLECLRQ